ncbi:Aft1 HRA domain-domain-containing protein [Naematelia encephala]|uniref:Aft1 HRA domain-domain-containing protein n=1 Tax=Naematelia encephala TaxID=71784 RepID=A0A1Y2AJU9_9TREE|nr:Aft1 HRA domain-domain-containing protein [Naematelia encephala]
MAAVAPPPAALPAGPVNTSSTRPSPHAESSNVERKASGGGENSGTTVRVQEASPIEDKKSDGAKSPTRTAPSDTLKRPSIRPNNVSSKFDLEPNVFEQSFSKSSNSAESDRTTPPRGGDATAIKHNALPPLSSLTSPAAADPSQFPWLANQSLRTGPLSPAMLAGPQGHHHQNGSTSRNGNDAGEAPAFDGTTFRTGFTPGTGSGFTPGYSSLMNGASFSQLPMPSPNTAAFLNMVTNSTPIGEGSEAQNGQQQSHEPPQTLHPPSAIPPHMQPHHGLSHISEHPAVPQETITPNTLSALTGVYNEMNRNQPPPPHQAPYFQPGLHPPVGPPMPPQMGGPVDYAQQSANAASQAANGLFLLSQAHQELSKREEEGRGTTPLMGKKTSVGAAPPGSGRPPNANVNSSGQKRKSDAGSAKPPAKRGKKSSIGSLTKDESTSPMFGDSDDDDDDEKPNPSGKPETEEEKRKNFLERNRQAALKCRQRKKAWLNELQSKVEHLTVENERLQQTIAGLHDEVGRLSGMLMQHRDCNLGVPTGYGRPIR